MRIAKYHGLGNDFLVALFPEIPLGADEARLWCDRHRGIGADGLLIAERPSPGSSEIVDGVSIDVRMTLFNADGSRAAMSGNGIRCFVHALHDADAASDRGAHRSWAVATDAGLRVVEILEHGSGAIQASVVMGKIDEGEPSSTWDAVGCHPDRPVAHLTIGNPHTVVGCDDVRAVDLIALGQQVPDVNLEIIEPGPEVDAITMRVHERGAGETLACGTGASVAAYAAKQWGLVHTDRVLVHMDGGDVEVRLHDGAATLIGPSVRIAVIDVDQPEVISRG
jgi:diaminopimelate epimerase